jgi:hypothetical protein
MFVGSDKRTSKSTCSRALVEVVALDFLFKGERETAQETPDSTSNRTVRLRCGWSRPKAGKEGFPSLQLDEEMESPGVSVAASE